MVIDIHAHILPHGTIESLAQRANDFPNVAVIRNGDEYRLRFAGGIPTRPIMAKLREPEPRRQWLKDQDIEVQLPGGWLDSFGYELADDEGAAWSRFLNEQMLAATSNDATLIPLATVPMQNGALAAEVLREAVAAGMPGAMIGTLPRGDGGNLDDPDLDPFWRTATELQVPIMIHPMYASGDTRLSDYEMVNAVGRVTDVSVAISRLLFSGHLLNYDGLKIIASTGGGALPWMIGRLERNHAVHPNRFADPVASLHRLYFDSIVFRAEALRFLVDLVGVDRVMLGSDYPFPIGDLTPRGVIENSGFNAEEIDAMQWANAARLFNLTRADNTSAVSAS